MITIDGAEGEGGGQVLRYSAALSLVTGEPFKITNIRGGRERPGMMRQHVTALEAAGVIGKADATGLTVGSRELTFRPGTVKPGEYHFAVGTAGSTALVLQTILVPLLYANGPSKLIIEGGTHAMSAPPFEFMARTLFPIIERMGPDLSIKLERHGFYPRGGGRVVVEINPSPLRPVECLERGELRSCRTEAIIAGVPFDIAERELKSARKVLKDWPEDAFQCRQLSADEGPGNAMLIEAEFDKVTEVMSGFGKLGVPAEKIGKTAAKRMAGYLASAAFAGPYLQDQLLLPFAFARGGAFTTVKQSLHTRTAMDLIHRFTGVSFKAANGPGTSTTIEVS